MKEREEVKGLWKGFLFVFGIVIIFWMIGLLFNHFNPPVGSKTFPIEDCGDFLPILLQLC